MGGLYPDPKKINPLNQEKPKQPDGGQKPSARLGRLAPPIAVVAGVGGSLRDHVYQERDQAGMGFFRDEVTFNPDGPGSLVNAAWHIPELPAAALATWNARQAAEEIYGEGNIHTGEGNAFLHAYMSYLLTEALGPKIARRFTDANEVKPPRLYGNMAKSFLPWTDITLEKANKNYRLFQNPQKEMKADLFNNGFGRRLFVEGLAIDRQDARDIIQKAIKNGNLSVID